MKIKFASLPDSFLLKIKSLKPGQSANINVGNRKTSSNRRFGFWFTSIVLVLIFIYILGAVVTGYLVYAKKSNSKTVMTLLSVYPFPAATVNNRAVKVSTVYRQAGYVDRFANQTKQKVDAPDVVRGRAIDQQVEHILVERELRKLGLKVSDDDIKAALKKIVDENGGEQEVEKVLKTLYGMSLNDFEDLIRNQLAKDKLQQEGLERVKVKHILVGDEARAKTLITDINENKKSFEDAAKEFSKDANSKDKGGDLGNITRGIMPPNFDEIAFTKAEIGKTYGEPIKTDFGYHVIRVDEKTGKITTSFQSWLDEAKKNAKIKIYLK